MTAAHEAPPRVPLRWRALLAWAALLLTSLGAGGAPAAVAARRAPEPAALAIVVHADNPTVDVSLEELRRLLLLQKQFWDPRTRVVLLARPASSVEQKVLLAKVYQMDEAALRKQFVQRLYAGEIPALPTVVKSCAAVAKLARQSRGVLTALLTDEVPEGVKVLRVEGRLPGEAGYPLVASD